MDKRYQVFVSSTYQDLQAERQEVMNALLELDCIPSGMELFPATNDTQWALIKKVIEDSDYYVLILAGRYGSLGPDGVSYTEMEYRHALSIGKPTISFLHKDPGHIIVDNSEQSPEGKLKLQSFRDLVTQKLCKYWQAPQDLGSVVSRSLIQLIKSTPAVGWVRADELADSDATSEILQLRRRVDELQLELAHARKAAPRGAEELAQGEENHEIAYHFRFISKSYASEIVWKSFTLRWNAIFAAIAPLMINEASESSLKGALDALAYSYNVLLLRRSTKFKDGECRDFYIGSDDFQTIKIQLRALGLITRSEKARSVKDSGTYWTLTAHGDEIMTQLRAIRRNPGQSQDTLADETEQPPGEQE